MLVPTPNSKLRLTTAACPSSTNILLDQQSVFHEVDKIKTFNEPRTSLVDNKTESLSIFSYCFNGCVMTHLVELEQPSCIS